MSYKLNLAAKQLMHRSCLSLRIAILLATNASFCWGRSEAADAGAQIQVVRVTAGGFLLGDAQSVRDGSKVIQLELGNVGNRVPYVQSAVKQSTAPALLGPDPGKPHYQVRFALPVPPDNDTNLNGSLTGLDGGVWAHNHSPGLEVLPNGDVLAVYFSARLANGESECDTNTRFVQARLRHGAEQWDMPEMFLDFEDMNDQSALLWREGATVRFFGGGRGSSPMMPFKMAVSTNHGATWTLSLPQLDRPTEDYTPQPIANAFRGADGAMYMAMDAKEDASFLWRSIDGGVHWQDMGGRTGARHSTIVPLDGHRRLLSVGGKNGGLDGWTPMNTSTDWGRNWSQSRPSSFPALGNNQRPCLIRLANGHLCYVTDTYSRKIGRSPEGWALGEGSVVAISTNQGVTWRMKRLPVELPHEKRERTIGTLGYATARQAPNGLIHVLTTMTQPCLHHEFNEAWVFSDIAEAVAEPGSDETREYREDYPNGSPKVQWSARICTNGRYVLEGRETSFHPNGKKEHEVVYAQGRRTGAEVFWGADGKRLWSWNHDLKKQISTWTHYWPNGRKRIESRWSTNPQARDLARKFTGLVAHGPARQWDAEGRLIRTHLFVNGALKPSGEKGGSSHVAN